MQTFLTFPRCNSCDFALSAYDVLNAAILKNAYNLAIFECEENENCSFTLLAGQAYAAYEFAVEGCKFHNGKCLILGHIAYNRQEPLFNILFIFLSSC